MGWMFIKAYEEYYLEMKSKSSEIKIIILLPIKSKPLTLFDAATIFYKSCDPKKYSPLPAPHMNFEFNSNQIAADTMLLFLKISALSSAGTPGFLSEL